MTLELRPVSNRTGAVRSVCWKRWPPLDGGRIMAARAVLLAAEWLKPTKTEIDVSMATWCCCCCFREGRRKLCVDFSIAPHTRWFRKAPPSLIMVDGYLALSSTHTHINRGSYSIFIILSACPEHSDTAASFAGRDATPHTHTPLLGWVHSSKSNTGRCQKQHKVQLFITPDVTRRSVHVYSNERDRDDGVCV